MHIRADADKMKNPAQQGVEIVLILMHWTPITYAFGVCH
jgi:hypothetical protein